MKLKSISLKKIQDYPTTLTEVSIRQTFEHTGLLDAGGRADGGSEAGNVRLRDLERHLTAGTHRQLGTLLVLTWTGGKRINGMIIDRMIGSSGSGKRY